MEADRGVCILQRPHRDGPPTASFPKDSYKDRLYTTGAAGYPGCKHIAGGIGEEKDFSEVIAHAKRCAAPVEIETRRESWAALPTIRCWLWRIRSWRPSSPAQSRNSSSWQAATAVPKSRNYYTELCQGPSEDAVILTAGCAKYKYQQAEPWRHRRNPPGTGCRPVQRFLFSWSSSP